MPDADSRTRAFPVRVRIDNAIANDVAEGSQPPLKPGMLARVHFPIGKEGNVLVVPQDALVLDRERSFVFIVVDSGEGPTVKRIQVEAGAVEGGLVQIRPLGITRISVGDRAIVEGNERLSPGQAVRVIE